MAPTQTLSVRLTAETRAALTKAAHSHDTAGASALARDILEKWVRKLALLEMREGMRNAVSFLLENPDWGDDPADFFPQVKDIP
jgi:hypothetical protein